MAISKKRGLGEVKVTIVRYLPMSILNKVRQFPEYHDMIDKSDKLRGDEVKMIDGYTNGYGECYNVYYKKQPQDLQESYETIGKVSTDLINSLKQDFSVKTDCQTAFASLKQRQETLLAEYNKMNAKEEEARKARETASKEEAKLANANSKGNQAEIAKQENIQQAARQKADTLTETANKMHSDYDASQKKHAVDFVDDWVSQMKKVIAAEKEVAGQYYNIGEAIYNAGQKFSTINDPSIPKLEERLKQWEEYQVD